MVVAFRLYEGYIYVISMLYLCYMDVICIYIYIYIYIYVICKLYVGYVDVAWRLYGC